MIRSNKPILVTGSHRSGSTWVGHMVASQPHVIYASEPFNRQENHRGNPVKCWWEYVTKEREEVFIEYLKPFLEFRHDWMKDFLDRPHPRRFVGASLRHLKALQHRVTNCRPLMKDPIAMFSTEWLAKTYGMGVIVLIRHPAAFVSSIKRLGWRFNFNELLHQRELMERYLQALEPKMREYHDLHEEKKLDILDEGILYWNIFHHVIHQFQQEHPEWGYFRHEDLSLNPLQEFGKMFAGVGLEMTEQSRVAIESHSGDENPAEAGGKIHQLKRNSRANIWNFTKRLTPEEITRIRAGTEEYACHFYSDEEWAPPREFVAV